MRIFLFGFIFVGMGSFVGAEDILTLQSSLGRVMKSNPRLLAARKEIDVARANINQARSLFFPKVNLNLNYVRYRHETIGITPEKLGATILEAPIESPTGDRANPLAENLYVGRMGFEQTLYAGGRLQTTYKLSKANIQKAENRYKILRKDVELNTKQIYFELLTLDQKISLVGEALDQLKKMSQESVSLHARLAVRRSVAKWRSLQNQFEQEKKNRFLELLQSMGMELSRVIHLKGDLELAPGESDFQTLLSWAKQNRVELKETVIQEELDQLSMDLSLSERYPIFRLGGGYEVRNRKFPLDESNWNAVLSMNIPIFDGFSSLARIKENRYKAQRNRMNRVELEDQIETEVRTHYEALKHWKEELNSRSEELKELTKMSVNYSGNRGKKRNVAERVDYWTWLTEARLNRVEAQYEHCLAHARLERAVGQSLTQ